MPCHIHDASISNHRPGMQAERLLKRCLEIQQRHSGDDNTLSIATTQTQLGGVCIVQANPRAAEGYLRGALDQIQIALGAKHPDTALSRCRLASCMADLTRYPLFGHQCLKLLFAK